MIKANIPRSSQTNGKLTAADSIIEKTIKTWKLFGIVIMSKTYNYPKTKEYDAVNISRA